MVTGDEILALALCLIFSSENKVSFFRQTTNRELPFLIYPNIELLQSQRRAQKSSVDTVLTPEIAELIEPVLQKQTALFPGEDLPELENLSGDCIRQIEPSLSVFFSRGTRLDSFYIGDVYQIKNILRETLEQTETKFFPQGSKVEEVEGEGGLTVVVASPGRYLSGDKKINSGELCKTKVVYSSVELPKDFADFTPLLSGAIELIPLGGRLFISKKFDDYSGESILAGEILSLFHAAYELCPFIYEQSFAHPGQAISFCGADGGAFFASMSEGNRDYLFLEPGYQRGIWMLSYIVNLCRRWQQGIETDILDSKVSV